MRRSSFLLVSIALSVPLFVHAVDTTDVTERFSDAPFPPGERAGISALVNAGVAEGNPDGTFAANRTLNRAEFLKIAMGARGLEAGESKRCFPDVPAEAWFSRFVCTARQLEIIAGYPDGTFHPERAVNYAEAVKIIARLFKYDLDPELMSAAKAGEIPWYQPYVRAAAAHKVLLPIAIEMDHHLTRGEMARFAAAAMSEMENQLDAYREAESGRRSSSSKSSTTSSSSSVSSVASSMSSSSSSVAVNPFPAMSHVLLLGETTRVLADARFLHNLGGDGHIRAVKVKLESKVDSFASLWLVDDKGETVGELKLLTTDSTDKTWRGEFSFSGSSVIPQSTSRSYGVIAMMKGRTTGGKVGELVRVSEMTLEIQGTETEPVQYAPHNDPHFPFHQVAQARLEKVSDASPPAGLLTPGENRLLASFAFAGEALPDTELTIRSLAIRMMTQNVALSKLEVGSRDTTFRSPCSIEAYDTTLISCDSLPTELGALGSDPLMLQIFGTVTSQNSGTHSVQLSLEKSGKIGEAGSVGWSDGVTTFTWVDQSSPLATGPVWTVQ